MSFERSLMGESIPLGEAAAFYLKLKTASYEPPDTTGTLEGQFTASIPEVLELMGSMVENEFKTMYAYKTYANSLRGLAHHSVADEFESHAEQEIEHADFLLRRMAVLGGPVHVPDIPAPPADADPVAIIQTMIRMEQEGIAKWKLLHGVTGDNPMKFKIEEYLTREQEHLDELWQMLPHEAQDMGVPSAPTGETPNQLGPQDAKLAGLRQALRDPIYKARRALGRTGTMEDIWHDAPAALHSLADKVKEHGGSALEGTKKIISENPGTAQILAAAVPIGVAGAALRGRDKDDKTASIFHEVLAKHAAKEHVEKAHLRAEGNLAARAKTHEGTRGELYGDLVGRLAGGAGGAFAGKKGGGIAQVAAAALGQHLGGKGGKAIGKELDTRRTNKKTAGVKFAFEDQMNMLAQTQAGEAAAFENQARFFQEKARSEQQAREQVEQQAQAAQQQLEQLQQQSQQQNEALTSTMQQANDTATQALMRAVQATQENIQSKQISADTLITHDTLKQKLRELADGGGTPGGPTNPQNAPPEAPPGQPGMGEPTGSPATEGPAGQAMGGQSAPGAAPPEGAQGPGGGNAPAESPPSGAQGAPNAIMGTTDMQPQGGPPKTASTKLASKGLMDLIAKRAPYALAGAAAGGLTHQALSSGGSGPLREAIQAAEAESHEGGFRDAMNLAQQKARLAFHEAAEAHPGMSLGMSALAGGALGAVRGPEVHQNLKDISKNISFLNR